MFNILALILHTQTYANGSDHKKVALRLIEMEIEDRRINCAIATHSAMRK